MLNIPTDMAPENVKEDLLQQNRELAINNGNRTKFCYITKRGTRNLVREVDPGTRKTNKNRSQTGVGKLKSRRLCNSKEMLLLQ